VQGFGSDAISPSLMKRSSLPAAGLRISQVISSLSYALGLAGMRFGRLCWVIILFMAGLSIKLSLRSPTITTYFRYDPSYSLLYPTIYVRGYPSSLLIFLGAAAYCEL
jgi:hypothetical protein